MTINVAILIDGGFLKRKLGSPDRQATAEMIKEFAERILAEPLLRDCRLHRIYFYDATPYAGKAGKPLEGGDVDYGSTETAIRGKQLHEQLCRMPFFSLRLGDVTHNGWAIKHRILEKAKGKELLVRHEHLAPLIQQKGVDMRIGLDIAALTLKKQARILVLVTGDSDFVPAMKFARREGAQLFLAPLGHGVRPQMLEHADVVLGTM